jgi:hypothetical protein
MKTIWKTVFLPLVLLISCNQDPIFTMISNEVEPKEPLIKGSPSNLAKHGDNIYVANGKLWSCYTESTDGRWSQVGGVPSKIYDIAAGTDGFTDGLYLLRVDNSDTTVYKLDGGAIGNPTGYGMIQGIYSDGDAVYAGAMSGNSYAILVVNYNAFTVIQTIGSPLAGVAKTSNATYFATANDGILRRESGGTITNIGGSGYSIAGIINAGSIGAKERIIAVTGNGYIFEVDGNTLKTYGTGTQFTGGLTVYTGNTANSGVKLLLLGVKNDIYNMGYREIDLTPDSYDNITYSLLTPGERASRSTVSGRDRYEATLAKYAVNSLIQLNEYSGGSDGLPVIFASTQKDGLFSYRNNEWNGEE